MRQWHQEQLVAEEAGGRSPATEMRQQAIAREDLEPGAVIHSQHLVCSLSASDGRQEIPQPRQMGDLQWADGSVLLQSGPPAGATSHDAQACSKMNAPHEANAGKASHLSCLRDAVHG